jgi:hypothetical protein
MKRGKSLVFLGVLILLIIFLISFVFANYDLIKEETFDLTVKGGLFCEDNGLKWVDYSGGIPISRSTIGLGANCNNSKATIKGTVCCPGGYSCKEAAPIPGVINIDQNGDPVYNCVLDNKFYCHQFNSSECEGEGKRPQEANRTVYEIKNGTCGVSYGWTQTGSGNTSKGCYKINDCYCSLNVSSNKCDAVQNVRTECTHTYNPPPEGFGNCTLELLNWDDKCLDEGYIQTTWKQYPSIDNPPADCTEGLIEKTIDCSSIIKMNFFDQYNFITAILLLVSIYSFYIISKKYQKKRI